MTRKLLIMFTLVVSTFAIGDNVSFNSVTLRHIQPAHATIEVRVGKQTVINEIEAGKIDGFLPLKLDSAKEFKSVEALKMYMKGKFCDADLYNQNEQTDNRYFGARIRGYKAEKVTFLATRYLKNGKYVHTSVRCDD